MTVLNGRYELLHPLDDGQTYAAQDLHQPGQPMACIVRQIRLGEDQSSEDLNREASALQRLNGNPQIPRLLAYFSEADQFYLVQEQIEGRPLSQDINPDCPLSSEQVMTLLHDLLTLLVTVHDHGVIHRDIRPDHILRRTADQQLCLVGFSVAKQVKPTTAANKAYPNSVMQLSAYAAPEQADRRVSYSSDLYAVGQVAIAALTGISPRMRDNPDPTENPPWRKQAQIQPAFADYLETLTQPDPSRRFGSAQRALDQLAQAKAEAEAVDTVVAAPGFHPISSLSSIHIPMRPVLMGTAAILGGLVIWGLGLGVVDWWRGRGTPVVTPRPAPPAYPEASLDDLACLYEGCLGEIRLQPNAVVDFWEMSAAAEADGVRLYPLQGFQSRAAKQDSLGDLPPAEQADKLAKTDYPTGYVIALGDVEAESADFNAAFRETDAFRWLQANADGYGFELSFPEGSPDFQPWRWRYLGDETSREWFAGP